MEVPLPPWFTPASKAPSHRLLTVPFPFNDMTTTKLPKLTEKGLLTPDNCVVAMIDLQPQMLFGVANFDRESIINSNVALGKAARICNQGSAWFSHDQERKGTLTVGQFADLAVLTDDFFPVEEERIKSIESVLTVLNGAVVHAVGDFADHAPPPLPVMPDWSPVAEFGGYGAPGYYAHHGSTCVATGDIHTATCGAQSTHPSGVLNRTTAISFPRLGQLWGSGCDCFAF